MIKVNHLAVPLWSLLHNKILLCKCEGCMTSTYNRICLPASIFHDKTWAQNAFLKVITETSCSTSDLCQMCLEKHCQQKLKQVKQPKKSDLWSSGDWKTRKRTRKMDRSNRQKPSHLYGTVGPNLLNQQVNSQSCRGWLKEVETEKK